MRKTPINWCHSMPNNRSAMGILCSLTARSAHRLRAVATDVAILFLIHIPQGPSPFVDLRPHFQMEIHMQAFDKYTEVWSQVQPLMRAKLTQIRSGLAERVPNRLGEIYEGGDEETRLSLDVFSDSLCIISLDFTLHDATVNGDESNGFSISFFVTGYSALALGGYMPKAYTAEAYTVDVSQIVDRIEALDTEAFVRHVCAEALIHEGLLRELAQAG